MKNQAAMFGARGETEREGRRWRERGKREGDERTREGGSGGRGKRGARGWGGGGRGRGLKKPM